MVGLKCPKCSSYNTVRCGNEEIPEDDGAGVGAGAGFGENLGDNDRDMVMRILNNLLRLRAGLRQNRDAGGGSDSDEDANEQPNDANEQPNDDAGNHEAVADIADQLEGDQEDDDGRSQPGSGANSSASLPSLENEDGSYDGDDSESESESESSASEEEGGGGEAAAGLGQPFPFLVSQLINNIFGGHDSSGDEEEEEEGDWPQHHHSDWSDSDSNATSSSVPNLLPDHSEDGWVTEEEEVIIGGVEPEETATASNLPASNCETVSSLDAQDRLDRNGVHPSAVSDSQDWETASEEVA